MTSVYLVQHGKAKSKDEDPERPLTTEGRLETERIANLTGRLELGIQEIRHSGKKRAKETADIFGDALGLTGLDKKSVLAVEGLHPTDNVEPVANGLAGLNEPVMLVGHLPFMPRLAGQLVNQNPEAAPVDFTNSGVLCLTRGAEGWKVDWQLTP